MTLKDCPNKKNHTPCPDGYIEWQNWAEEKGKKFKQIKCSYCKLYAIWVPK